MMRYGSIRYTMTRTICLALLLLAPTPVVIAAEPAATQPASEPSATTKPGDRPALEADFQKLMTRAVLVGHFSVDGQDAPAKQDRYTIVRATKLQNDIWLFTVRIEFGGKDVTVPMPVPVRWAGDTPVISVTDLTVPGIGTYTARVVIYRDRYAGTWNGADHGGEMWGHIERAK